MELNVKRAYAKPSEQDNQPGLLNTGGVSSHGPLRWLTTFLVLVFPTAALFVNRGDSYTLGLLSLIGLWVWVRHSARPFLNQASAMLWLAFVLFFAIAVLTYETGLQTEDGFHFLGRYLRFLFIVPVYLAFRHYLPTAKTVFIGLALGALVSGALSWLQFLHAHGPIRVAATTDLSIIFGDLATTMVLGTVAGFGLLAASRRTWAVPVLVLCLAGGVAASLLSGTRGAWIPLLLLPLGMMMFVARTLKYRHIVFILLAVIAVFSSFYLSARSGTHERIASIAKNTSNYFVSFRASPKWPKTPANTMICANSQAFLTAWLQASYQAAAMRQHSSVIADNGIPHRYQCTYHYAVQMHNDSEQTEYQAIFPRLADTVGKTQHTYILVRGTGSLSFGGKQTTNVDFDTDKYSLINLMSSATTGTSITLSIPPAGSVWLVPLEGHYGEYTMVLANTSVGQRFEMWRAAWHLFLTSPIVGVGVGAYQISTDQLVSQNEIAPFVRDFDHPHNDYLNALASSGILGLGVLIAILFLPLRRFWQFVTSTNPATHAMGMAGVLTVVGFAIYALTDTIFLHSMMITWYVIYIALFYALLDAQENQSVKPESPKQ